MEEHHWQKLLIEGVACVVMAPAQPQAMIIFLHGMDGHTLTDFPAWKDLAIKHQIQLICPSGMDFSHLPPEASIDHTNAPYCWWMNTGKMPMVSVAGQPADTITPEDWVVHKLYSALRQHDRPIAISGYEVGGHGALRIAYRNARQFPMVMAIQPKIDLHRIYGLGTSLDHLYPSEEAVRQQEATVWLHVLDRPKYQYITCDPENTFCYPGCQTLLTKLSSTGCPYQYEPHHPDLNAASSDQHQHIVNTTAENCFRFLSNVLLRV